MKKIIYGIALFVMAFTFSCKEDYMMYDKEQINKIYFEEKEAEFVYGPRKDKDEDLVLKVNLIGFANLDGESQFKVEPDEQRSTAKYGVHYDFVEEPIFGKDSTVAYVRLNFKREALVKDVRYIIHLNLAENEKYAPTNITKCVVEFGDVYVPQPTWWLPDRLGTYTPEKYILFVDLFHQTKGEYPDIYNQIEGLWGEYLDKTDNYRHMYLLTTMVYLGYLKKGIYEPMYEYYLATGDEKYRIPNPMEAVDY